MRLNSIFIGFSTARDPNPIAWVIRKVEGTPYSHVYLEIKSESLARSLIYHASHTTLHFTGLQRFAQTNKIIEEFELLVTDEQQQQILQYCIDHADTPYGAMELLGIGWVRLCRKFGKKVRNPFRDGQRTQVCSELIGNVLRILGEKIDPAMLETEGPRWIYDRVVDFVNRQQGVAHE